MTDSPDELAALEAAVAAADWPRVEEQWLEALDRTPVATSALLEVARRLASSGHAGLARTLLELLADSLEAAEDHGAALAALRELVGLAEKRPPGALVARLERVFSASRAGSPSLGRVVERYGLATARRPLEVLQAMERWLDHDLGSVVEVIGQGVGRVTDLNLELDNIRVEIPGSRPVSVPFGAVARYLRPLPPGDFRRRRVEDLDELQRFVAAEPGQALVELLASLGEAANASTVKSALDGILSADQWTAWWGRARTHPRVISTGAGSRLRYRLSDSAEAATGSLLEALRAVEPRDRLQVARRLAARGEDDAAAAGAVLTETLADLEVSDPGLAWETAGLLRTLPGGQAAASACHERLLASTDPLHLLSGLEDRLGRAEVLAAVRASRSEDWTRIWAGWLPSEDHPANLLTLARELEVAGAGDQLRAALETVFRDHLNHPAQLVWACEAMTEEPCPEAVRRRMTPSVLEFLLDALTRPELASVRTRAKALLDGGRVAIRLVLEQASPAQAGRFEQRLARLPGLEPQRLALIQQAVRQRTATPVTEAPALVASRAAVEARREELRQLLEVDIPRTLKGINAAAAEGDLSENFEYHMLRERQELLSARAAALKRDLARVHVVEPGAANVERVNIGTVVYLEGVDGEPVQPLTILGPWDAVVEQRVFADGSDLAQGILGRRPGDEVEVEGKRARITRIEAWVG